MTTVKSCELVRLAPPFGRSIGGNMSGEIEALGALTTAGLAASVVDGDAGQSGNEQRVCANCATPLEYHSDFAVREGNADPRLLPDASPVDVEDCGQPDS